MAKAGRRIASSKAVITALDIVMTDSHLADTGLALGAPHEGEQRTAPRKRVVLGGLVICNNGSFTTKCRIKDISETGARFVLPKGQVAAENTILIEIQTRVVHEATVARIDATEYGLEFTSTYALDGPLPGNLQFVKRFR